MLSALVQADTDTLSWEPVQWRLVQMHTAVVVEPPATQSRRLLPVVQDENRKFQLVPSAPVSRIGWDDHRRLLRESMQKYSDIWESLAQA